ncbi:hypothetical protein PWYN_23380 [Paenibacillus wynnii]|uniref:Carbohydrate esterase 2 N-terminal domain-containing protein n=1 Tax=Paenibacillus wynnii TaxID=268407 RepID=A0A098M6A4_9BACL|nr:hypothetical protein PWYN_23380 [Paenibacillus wynnii]
MKKLIIPIALSFLLIFTFTQNIFAASVGDLLPSPESGWTRYNYNTPEITYSGGTWNALPAPICYGSQWQQSGAKIQFNFNGTKVRLISPTWSSFSTDVDVLIDGQFVQKISLNGPESSSRKIMFEKIGLPQGEHSVEFVNNTMNYLSIAAIDVDGTLTSYTPAPTQTPTPTATATTSPTVTPSVIPSPTPEIPTGDRALLSITLENGFDKEFDLPMSEITTFLNWYDGASGSAKYGINKHDNNKGPFEKRTEYVIHNKILTFEVSEYTAQ